MIYSDAPLRYPKMPKTSIIIPVIRPDKAKRCIAAIGTNAGVDDYEIVAEEDTERIGCPRMVQRLVAQTKYDLVCFLGDDTIPQPDFLKNALAAMETLPDGWGLVSLNDQHQNGDKLATHWLADKRLLPLLDGTFFHTGYKHTRCDQELVCRCKAIGRHVWAKDAIIKHNHPTFGTAEVDKDYVRSYLKENLEYDKELFWVRSQNNWITPPGWGPRVYEAE